MGESLPVWCKHGAPLILPALSASAMSSDRLALIAGSSNPELSADIAKYLGVPLGEAVLEKFNDGVFPFVSYLHWT